mgnify:FL=1
MTEDDIKEEAGILALACGQLGAELAQGRLAAAEAVHRQLGAILRKFGALQETAAQQMQAKTNGQAPLGNDGEPPPA